MEISFLHVKIINVQIFGAAYFTCVLAKNRKWQLGNFSETEMVIVLCDTISILPGAGPCQRSS